MSIDITTDGKHEAAAETHLGRVIGITDSRLDIKSDDLTENSFSVVHDVRVTRNVSRCRVDDLRLGVTVRITTRKDDVREAIAIEWIDRVA